MKYLIVGLGNPGDEYQDTRHNIGFMVLDALAKASDTVFEDRRYGFVANMRIKNRELVLLKPTTFMNLSGNAVRYWMNELDIPLENLIVICDDINLPFGTIRMRTRGSDGGHNGLFNIEELLETRDYARIRVGVGHDFSEGGQIGFVLGTFSPEQAEELPSIAEKVRSGVQTWALAGAQKAMTELNTRPNQVENATNQ